MLLIGCGRGDAHDFAQLYDETISWMFCIACGAAQDGLAAEALTAGIYRRIWFRSARFDSRSPCAIAWLLRQANDQITAT